VIKITEFSPLIHSKTFKVDFRENFLVVPEDFSMNKISWAKKYVLSSTSYMEYLQDDIRKVIFSDGEHCVIGITCYLRSLSSLCNEEIKEIRDSANRPVFAFLGFVSKITKESEVKIYNIPIRNYFDLYKQFVIPRWLESVAHDPVKEIYREVSTISIKDNLNKGIPTTPVKLDGYEIFGCDPFIEGQLISSTLSDVTLGRSVSLCTNMANIKMIKDSDFQKVTCPDAVNFYDDTLEPEVIIKKSPVKESGKTPIGLIKNYSNNNCSNVQIRSVEKKGKFVRIAVMIGGILYLILAPVKSIPLSLITGAGIVGLAGYELINLINKGTVKKKIIPTSRGRFNTNNSFNEKIYNSKPSRSDNDNDIFKL